MSMKLNEWNMAIDYAKEVSKDLADDGYDIQTKPYRMYDGRKGMYLEIYDNAGIIHKQYASGIHSDIGEFKKAINRLAARIKKEV